MKHKATPSHVLVIRLSAMGDIAIAAPVVYAFAKAYPEVKITFLTKPFFKPIVAAIPGCQCITAATGEEHRGIQGIWKLARQMRQYRITAIADLHNVLRSKMLRKFLRIPAAKIDKGRAEKKALTRSKNKIFKSLTPTISRYMNVFEALGYPIEEPLSLPVKTLPQEVVAYLDDVAATHIGVAPFAAHPGKQYPLDLMKEVISGLLEQTTATLHLFGGPNEKEALTVLAADSERVQVVAGRFSYASELSLISHLSLMLSMDSGNGHLAAMYGVTTVTLWGVTHPYAGFAPWKQEAHCITADRAQYPFIPTSIFGNKMPPGYEEVMRTISPQVVVDKISQLL